MTETVIASVLVAALAGIVLWVLFVDQGGPSPREMARRDAAFRAQQQARQAPCRDQTGEVRAYRSGRAVLREMGENQ